MRYPHQLRSRSLDRCDTLISSDRAYLGREMSEGETFAAPPAAGGQPTPTGKLGAPGLKSGGIHSNTRTTCLNYKAHGLQTYSMNAGSCRKELQMHTHACNKSASIPRDGPLCPPLAHTSEQCLTRSRHLSRKNMLSTTNDELAAPMAPVGVQSAPTQDQQVQLDVTRPSTNKKPNPPSPYGISRYIMDSN